MTRGEAVWLGAGVIALVWWWADLYFHPYAPCRSCQGTGWNKGSRRSAKGLCRHGPLRLRVGARLVHKQLRSRRK